MVEDKYIYIKNGAELQAPVSNLPRSARAETTKLPACVYPHGKTQEGKGEELNVYLFESLKLPFGDFPTFCCTVINLSRHFFLIYIISLHWCLLIFPTVILFKR